MRQVRKWGIMGAVLFLGIFLSPMKPALAYNGSAAASYADSWWNSRNGAYLNFPDDCTNFVSQALHAGGESEIGYPSNFSDSAWWMDTPNGQWTHSWSVADDLYLSLTNYTSRGILEDASFHPQGGGVDSIGQGDVLFYDWGQGQNISHSAIQVVNNGHDATYPLSGSLVDQHTNDRYHEIWNLYPTNPYWSTTDIYEVHIY